MSIMASHTTAGAAKRTSITTVMGTDTGITEDTTGIMAMGTRVGITTRTGNTSITRPTPNTTGFAEKTI